MTRQNALKYILPVIAVALLLMLAAWALRLPPVAALTGSNPSANQPDRPEQVAANPYDKIVVVGTGKATGIPDRANLSLAVSVTADTVAAAREQAAASMQEVLDTLATRRIASTDIKTTHFSVHPRYDWIGGERLFRGYNVSNQLSVTVRDTAGVGPIIDAVIAAGGNDIQFNHLSFHFSDTAALEEQARQAAVADMEEKARQLAQFSGRTLGRLRIISETPVTDVFGVTRELAAGAADAGPGTVISVGEGEVTVSIHGVYELR